MRPVEIGVPLEVSIKVPADIPAEPLKERTELNLEKESGRCVELEKACRGLRISNENVQKVTVNLVARPEKSREAYEAASKRSERLIIIAEKREKMHIEELAKSEARRAEEAHVAEELRGKLADTKTAEEDLHIEHMALLVVEVTTSGVVSIQFRGFG
ncbi:hypothetical protein AXG93_4155s1010 [Marchantia polymorpha subsp. ruderalis]|uniref:Uncharacterized protein n=1 Tax=Marchantia polymorpha subsp. ruderalis TaxID=1480154 RepID=A0A176VPW6_MARPO|nr:hypothetical protein AXG93_4155s1010 [Marchantia polymorpha subsp. ruderalis]